jgi:hypothetical protein
VAGKACEAFSYTAVRVCLTAFSFKAASMKGLAERQACENPSLACQHFSMRFCASI